MTVAARRVEYDEIVPFRRRFTEEAECQVVRDSILPRGLADSWLIERDSVAVGYGGIWNAHFPGRLMEFWVDPAHRASTDELYRAVIRDGGATAVEAQTNLPGMIEPLQALGGTVLEENLLFEEGGATDLLLPGAVLRERCDTDAGPEGDFVVEMGSQVVAAGGFLRHYNAPFVDLYLAVSGESRGRGVGSWLVQELRRVVREEGLVPSARCDRHNEASRRTLERGGLRECGRIVTCEVPRSGRTDGNQLAR